MEQNHKLMTAHLHIPYKGSGNIIYQKPVDIDVFKHENGYKAVPQMQESERRVANLPPEMIFTYNQGRAQSSRGHVDGNQHVLDDLIEEMKKEKIL
ncbi:MAG TPA: hypothetical protein VNS32_25640 [Flavisolibacter sp.]|nr:hypothetical protein [Flavisolibacter sp.]